MMAYSEYQGTHDQATGLIIALRIVLCGGLGMTEGAST